jgi:hypothetical protein
MLLRNEAYMGSKDCSLSGVKILIIDDEPEVLALT